MIRRGSSRPDVIKLADLIEMYLNYKDNFKAKEELINTPIKGEDLIDALENINLNRESEKYEKLKGEYTDLQANYERLNKDYDQLDEDHKKLLNALELIMEEIINDPFVKKIKNIINVIKEVKQ